MEILIINSKRFQDTGKNAQKILHCVMRSANFPKFSDHDLTLWNSHFLSQILSSQKYK